jgi:two-component system, NarL family, response regulator
MVIRAGVIRILTVDDHPLLRGGIAALIGTQSDMELVAEASTGREGIEQFRAVRPDVTLLDLQMPEMGGIDALIAIRSEWPSAKVIVLTTYGGDALAERALKAGAQAYVLKALVGDELLEIIRAIHRGQKRVHPTVAAQLASHLGEETLSSRELQVLMLVAAGNPNKVIAARLAISEDTAKAHVASVIAKLRANDRTHAVTLARERGMIPP